MKKAEIGAVLLVLVGLSAAACGGNGATDTSDDAASGTGGDGTDASGTGSTSSSGSSTSTGSGSSSGTAGGSEMVTNDKAECNDVITGSLTSCVATSEVDPNFSFFVASRVSMVALSGNAKGFGGNLGGLGCADQVCSLIAECVAPANGKTWHAFLSTADEDAKDRIGSGPWYDALGVKLADNLSGLVSQVRPVTADGTVNHNLRNEFGCENLTPACDGVKEDNHHVMTGSSKAGVFVSGRTCSDWTSSAATAGSGPAVGLSWERGLWGGMLGGVPGGMSGGGGTEWLNYENESGCAPGGNLTNSPPQGSNDGTVGSGGGYGAIYCFAVTGG